MVCIVSAVPKTSVGRIPDPAYDFDMRSLPRCVSNVRSSSELIQNH